MSKLSNNLILSSDNLSFSDRILLTHEANLNSSLSLSFERFGILLYFSDTDEDTGSGIGFRDPVTKIEHAFFYPKSGDVCIINHTTKFEHRVTPQNIPIPRIVASFHYYVDTLN